MTDLRSNLAANLAGMAWTAGLQFLFVRVYLSYLGVEGYALIGFFLMILGVSRIFDFGGGATINRELARRAGSASDHMEMRDLLRTLELLSWLVGIVLGALLIGAAPWIATQWLSSGKIGSSTIEASLILMGLALALQWPSSLYQSGLFGLERQVRLNVIRIATTTLLHVGAVVVLVFLSPTLTGYFSWVVFASALQSIWYRWALWKAMPGLGSGRVRPRLVGTIWRFATGIAAITVLSLLMTQLDKLILSKLISLEMFGYYMIAALLASSLVIIIDPVFNTLFPRFSALAPNNVQSLELLYHRGAQLMALLLLPLAITLAFFSEELILLWTGDQMVAEMAAPIASLLISGTAVNGILNLPYALQLSYGWTRMAFLIAAGMALIYLPLLLVLVRYFGVLGAATAWVVVNLLSLLVGPVVTHRYLLVGAYAQWIRKDVLLPLAGSILSCSLVAWILPREGNWLDMGAIVLAFTLAFGATVLLASEMRREFKLMATRALTKI